MLTITSSRVGNHIYDWENLFLVISTTQKGDEIASTFHEEFLKNKDLSPFNALKNAVSKTTTAFSNQIANLDIATAFYIDNIIYNACVGNAKISLSRGGAQATLLESKSSEIITASGYPRGGDILILTTKESSLTLSFNERELIINQPPELTTTPNQLKVFGKILSFFKNLTIKLPSPRIYVKEAHEFEMESQGKKTTLSIGIILLLVLVTSIVFGIRQKNINEVKSKYEGILIEANKNLDEAIGLVSVSPDRARELFVEAQEKLNQIESFKTKDPEIEKLKAKIETQKSLAFKEYNVTPELFLDLTLLSSGFTGEKITASEGDLFVLDKKGKRVVNIELESKKSKVVAGEDKVGEVDDIASYSDRVFVLNNDGVRKIKSDATTVVEKSWEGDVFIYGFAGNIYILDKFENQIYRYAGSGSSFSEKQNWLSTSTKPDFSNAKSWVIDGAVYVLNENGKILKFSLGSPQAFSLSGIFPEINNIDAIYSDDESEFFYILDAKTKRVIVTDKKGNYKAQYTGEGIDKAVGLTVSEKEGKIILLTGEKLLSINLVK